MLLTGVVHVARRGADDLALVCPGPGLHGRRGSDTNSRVLTANGCHTVTQSSTRRTRRQCLLVINTRAGQEFKRIHTYPVSDVEVKIVILLSVEKT